MHPRSPTHVRLRATTLDDVPLLHAFELDAKANELAGTKPRDWATFQARWQEILADPGGKVTGVTPRVIVADDELVGAVNISPQEGAAAIGYWLAREHWGRGIASRAVALMLKEYPARPLFATAASHNQPSLRILHKHGFIENSRVLTPETSRTVARETVTLVLQ